MATYMESEMPTVISSGNNGGGNNGGFGWGNDAWVLIILFALIFGWGNGNGFGNGGGGQVIYDTGAGMQRGFDTANIVTKLDGINHGLCDGFYAMNTGMLNGFSGVQQTLAQGFAGTNTSIMQNGYETRGAISDLGYRLQDCCCQTQRAIDGVNYNMAKNTCDLITAGTMNTRDIIDNANANFRALHDELIANKIEAKNERIAEQAAQINALQLAASQAKQNNELISALGPKTPVPAYPVFAPSTSLIYPTGVSFGVNGNYGCGCTSAQ